MMIYQLFIAAALGFATFTSISDANCKFWFDTCVGSCAVPNNRTIRICQLECELETLEIEANPASTHNDTMCVEKCLTDPDVVTDCQEGCEEAYEACEQGCSAARVIASLVNHTEAENQYYNCTGKPKPMQRNATVNDTLKDDKN